MKKIILQKIVILLFLQIISFSLRAQLANNECVSATPIIIPASGQICISSTNLGATTDNIFATGCETAPGLDVWFTYISNGVNNIITVTPNGATPARQVVAILHPDCVSTTITDCNASATATGTATVTEPILAGTQVWVEVTDRQGAGTFQICINSAEPPPTPGKQCSTATPLCNLDDIALNSVTNGTNSDPRPSCFASGLQQPIYWKFTVGQTGTLSWLLTSNCVTATEFDWALYNITAGCPTTNGQVTSRQVACNYSYTNGVATDFGMQGTVAAACNRSQGLFD